MAITLEIGYFNSFYVKRIAGYDSLGKIIPLQEENATYPWTGPMTSNVAQDWYIEESRIRGGYNNRWLIKIIF